jgi:hypothetical protein
VITATKGLRNEQMARCQCDQCPAEVSVRAAHRSDVRVAGGGRFKPEIASPGQVHEKLQSMGWGIVKSRLYCPACEADRKAKSPTQPPQEASPMPPTLTTTNIAQIRQPTPEQEVDIIVTLSAVYDRKAKRYQGAETDKSVAETVGAGVMPGWVAAIRQAKFGPAGNEEIELIRDSLAKMQADHESRIEALRRDLDKAIAQMTKRLDACIAAHDRRVG